ncbi:hypothetical protein VTI74DRAFT_1743 [Chaetomium olivicolor]
MPHHGCQPLRFSASSPSLRKLPASVIKLPLIHPSIWFHRRPSRVHRSGRKELLQESWPSAMSLAGSRQDVNWQFDSRGGEGMLIYQFLGCPDQCYPCWALVNAVNRSGSGSAVAFPLFGLFPGSFLKLAKSAQNPPPSKARASSSLVGLTATAARTRAGEAWNDCQPMFWNLAPPHMFGRENQTTACWRQPGPSTPTPKLPGK